MMKRASFVRWFIAASAVVAGPKVWACSSCGSGGADPVILNPNENSKFYLGLSYQSGFKDVDLHGDTVKSYGPKLKETMDLAFAQRLLPRVFASVVANFGRNAYGSESTMQNGDITLNSRTTVVNQSLAEPWVPQVQLMLSHRFAVARSIYDAKQDHLLDVFGAGYDETYLGADVWFGMNAIMFGGSFIYGIPGTAETDAGNVKPGPVQRWIGTVGGMPIEDVKLIGGVVHEQRSGFKLDDTEQPSSDRLSQDLFLTMETLYPEGSNYRLSLSRRAAFGANKNGVKVNVVTLAWMRTL